MRPELCAAGEVGMVLSAEAVLAEVAVIAATSTGVHERAAALLGPLRRLVGFDAAHISLLSGEVG